MKNDAQNQIAGAYGSLPVTTGAQTVDLPTYCYEADEATTFGVFRDSAGLELSFHPWKGKTLGAGKTAFFGQDVHSFTITAGGAGQLFLATDVMPVPVLLTASTNAAGTLIILTYDRVMSNPAARLVDFSSTLNGAANVLTGVASGADTKTIEITVTTAIEFMDAVTISMAYGYITTTRGAKALPLVAQAVVNIVPE